MGYCLFLESCLRYENTLQRTVVSFYLQVDGVWALLVREQDADVTAVGIVFGDAVLAMQKTVICRTMAIGMGEQSVLGQSDGVR